MILVMDKKLEDMTFEELKEDAARDICDSIISHGFSSVRGRLHIWMATAIQWRKKRDEKEKLERKKK